jgi:AcrR family transcriptional regulator
MNKNVERCHATRDHLVAVATRLFGERGYEDTSIEAVLQESGVSRGSLYHHFAGKDALFEAVLDAVLDRTGREMIVVAGAELDPVASMLAGCLAWIRLAADPVVRQVILTDAPAVLGWDRWRTKDQNHALALVRGGVAAAADAAKLPPATVDMIAHMLFAAMNEIAMVVARADDQSLAMRQGEAAVEEFVRRLLGG